MSSAYGNPATEAMDIKTLAAQVILTAAEGKATLIGITLNLAPVVEGEGSRKTGDLSQDSLWGCV